MRINTPSRGVLDELLQAGPTADLALGNHVFGISKTTGYALVKAGKYPVRVLKIGSSYRIVTAELRELLGIERHFDAPADAA